MKKKSAVVIMWVFIILTLKMQAQISRAWQTKEIAPYHVAVAYSKTTNIIFPYSIIGVDIGSSDVLAQKAKGVENILQIKAAKENFPQTNISVITADGKLTSFLVDFAAFPSVLNLSFIPDDKPNILSSGNFNMQQLEYFSVMAANSRLKIGGIKDKAFGMRLKLNGLFIHDEMMFLRFTISNETNISYDIDQFRLFIRDQKKAKRTASQELEMILLFVYNNSGKITGQSENTIVFVVKKFTIPDKKYLSVQLMEKDGGRHLRLHVKNRKLVKAISIQ